MFRKPNSFTDLTLPFILAFFAYQAGANAGTTEGTGFLVGAVCTGMVLFMDQAQKQRPAQD